MQNRRKATRPSPAETWAQMKPGIDSYMNAPNVPMPYAAYMDITARLHDCLALPPNGRPVTLDSAGGPELHNMLKEYLESHLEPLRHASAALENEALLRYYTREWKRYKATMTYLDRLLSHLNRHWVQQKRALGSSDIYPIYTLGLAAWKSTVFLHVQPQLTSAVLRLIEQERNGVSIDRDLVKTVVDSYVSLGVDNTELDKVCLDVYKEFLEAPFVEATEAYYRTKLEASEEFRVQSRMEELLKEEEDRVMQCLNPATWEVLSGKLEEVFAAKDP